MNDRVLLTGASGFLGQYLLRSWNPDEITTLGTTQIPGIKHISADLKEAFKINDPFDFVIHAAGKAHSVPRSAQEQAEFFHVNVEGTRNLLEALVNSPKIPGHFLYISSVAVYGRTSGEAIEEEVPLLAKDAYGASKIEAEKIIAQWCQEHQVTLTIFRLPLIVGKHPRGNLSKMIRAVQAGRWWHIDQGKARRSMVLASDIASIVPRALRRGGIYNLTDGHHPSYGDLYASIARVFNKGPAANMPMFVARVLAKSGDLIGKRAPFNSKVLEKLSQSLIFSDQKARVHLSWKPRKVLEHIEATLEAS